ncbi:F-box/kelch-repeat protein [Prunus yedoensis var. nudiflora]|uniref:F-box/kelch-repeat protein n=1 Tax=Prunus yedoensis var. nudiflora TaxID=2094558 RepID=A0A314ZEI9_PRUYE|nr:F-box/kelch-repeat protein [Prunus yedoensis var. nudiflora]
MSSKLERVLRVFSSSLFFSNAAQRTTSLRQLHFFGSAQQDQKFCYNCLNVQDMDDIQEDITEGMQELNFKAMALSFPQEIIHEILLRLPVKSLIKCTSVCKAWRSMIMNKSFIRAHISQINNMNDSHLFLVHRVSGRESSTSSHIANVSEVTEEVYSLHYDNQAFDEYAKIEFPIAPKQEVLNEHLRVVGTCDGLICLADDMPCYCYNFFIWNPAIRKLVTLPRPGITFRTHGGYDASIGFGFDAITNDYKVVRVVTLQHEGVGPTLAEVYSLATGSWTSVGSVTPSCQLIRASQAFVNGALHWPAHRWTDYGATYFILTFEVGRDGKSIALFSMDNRCEDSFLEIWVMKEYGMEESWTKLVTLGPQGPERLLPRASCFRKSGEVLLILSGAREAFSMGSILSNQYTFYGHRAESNHELVSLDLVSKTIKNLGISGEGYQYCNVDSYKESLVLSDQTGAVSY